MKPEDNVKKLYEKAAVNTNPEMDDAVLDKILAAQAKPNIWRIIMKNPVIKFVAAAIVIVGVFILFIYSTGGQDSQQNRELYIVKPDDNNRTELPISSDHLAEDLLHANQLFENNDISGLSQLLSNEFEAVQFQAAKYLGQIGDESVLAELQVLADQWQGPKEENVFQNAISVINERLADSKQELPRTINDQEPDETKIITNDIKNPKSGITDNGETIRQTPNNTTTLGFQELTDNEYEDTPEEREAVLFGTVIDLQNNPVTGAKVFASYAESGITDNNGEFALLAPPTDSSGSIGPADFPMFVWSLTDDPYKIAWTLIRNPEAAEDSNSDYYLISSDSDIVSSSTDESEQTEEYPKTEETHQGVELIIEDENDLFINIPGVPGEFLDIDGDINVKDIVLVMGSADVISGQIRGIEGQPLANTVVRVEELHMQLGINELIISDFDQQWKSGPECVTDDQGYYTLTNIPDCWSEVYLSIYAPGFTKTDETIIKNGDWNIRIREDDLDYENDTSNEQETVLELPEVPESLGRPELLITSDDDEDQDKHFQDVLADGYPFRGGKDSISEIILSYFKKNLILYYSFDSMNNTETVTDISGNNYYGQVFGANYAWDEILGGIMSFDGDNDYITLPSLYLDKFTFSGWIKTTTNDLNNRRIFLLDDGENYYAIQGNSNEGIGVYITEDLEINEYDHKLEKGKWTYITITFDSHTACIYTNGQLTESGIRTFSAGIAGNAYIGFSGNIEDDERHDGDYCWQGMIDEVALFDRALTAEEVEQLFLMTGTYIQQ